METNSISGEKLADEKVSYTLKQVIFSDPKVLVVDDDKSIREQVCKLLTPYCVQVDQASSGHEAIELISKEFYPLIICDHMMSNGMGDDVYKFVLKNGISTLYVVFSGCDDRSLLKHYDPDRALMISLKDFKFLGATIGYVVPKIKCNRENVRRDLESEKIQEVSSGLENSGSKNQEVYENSCSQTKIGKKLWNLFKMPFIVSFHLIMKVFKLLFLPRVEAYSCVDNSKEKYHRYSDYPARFWIY